MAFFTSGERGDGFLSAAHLRVGRILFQIGCAIILLYFPSGVMHAVFGKAVYIRDGLLLLHLAACLVWLFWTGKARLFWRRSWFLAVPALFILPTVIMPTYRVEGLTFIKWTACWLDWVILGQLARTVLTGFEVPVHVFLGCAMLLLLADAGAGLYEAKTKAYLLHEEAELSAFGVPVARESRLLGHLRVKGLQRDVFSYSNLMAMSVVAGMLVFLSQTALAAQVTSVLWILGFAICLFESGGRSAFFGVFGAALVTGGLLMLPALTRRSYRTIVGVWLGAALLISIIGVGALAESVGGSVMQGSDIGNSDSAYMRDANWKGITEAIKDLPVVLVSGAPVASLVDSVIEPIYHWADNQYLWLLYHTSIIGLLAVIAYFVFVLRLPEVPGSEWARDGLVMFLLFVMGEGVARESMTFLGCMPLFILCGWQSSVLSPVPERSSRSSSGRPNPAKPASVGGRSPFRGQFSVGSGSVAAERPVSSARTVAAKPAPAAVVKRPAADERSSASRPQNPSKPRSEADEFARRIRSAARRQRKE